MNKNILFFAFAFFATSLVSAQPSSLEPFESWQKKNLNWAGDPSELAYVSVRCSALYLVIGTVFAELGRKPDQKAKGNDIKSRSVALTLFGSTMGETVGWSTQRSLQRFEANTDLYMKIITSNRVNHNNMFHGFVEGDYQFCLDFEQIIRAVANQVNDK
jgi:hypothetical protein